VSGFDGRPWIRSTSILLAMAPAALLAILAAPASAAFAFPTAPTWQSTPQGDVSTGCAFRDLNGDGYPDLIVANGNDIARQHLVVYRSQGGVLPATPTWTSADVDYHGHLDLADVDADGILDCAVAVYLGASGFSSPGYVKLYRGNGDATFSANPVWTSQDRFYCFSVSFGDVDLDGRPDLACTAGESYNRQKERLRLYRNVGGTLGTLPYWLSADTRYSLDVTWGDVNGDGYPDVAYACESNPTVTDPVTYPSEVYLGNGTTLAANPGWRSQDGHDYSNTLAFGDVNGDGWLDLAIADNNQLQGGAEYGRTKLFLNDGSGHLGALPSWTSLWSGYGSNVSWVDADHDGDLDLAAGSWWGPVRLYENAGGALPGSPTWQSATGSVIENIAWEDADNDGRELMLSNFTGNGSRKLFTLPRRPVRIREVAVDEIPLAPAGFFACAEQGWLTLAQAPPPGARIKVDYTTSADLDFAVSNWDTEVGNYLFLNGLNPTATEMAQAPGRPELLVSPNPTFGPCRILLAGASTGRARVEIFSPAGARVRSFHADLGGGSRTIRWDGRSENGEPLAAGTYWVRVLDSGGSQSQRIVLIR
jgi:hypothetical protein